mmetsp:Transcript_15875/g.32210  ORF Transcript_15875/g.32210 Transcript_15875/m.32210 type:complete len:226 (+) Transcript_15875:1096-1773(+)
MARRSSIKRPCDGKPPKGEGLTGAGNDPGLELAHRGAAKGSGAAVAKRKSGGGAGQRSGGGGGATDKTLWFGPLSVAGLLSALALPPIVTEIRGALMALPARSPALGTAGLALALGAAVCPRRRTNCCLPHKVHSASRLTVPLVWLGLVGRTPADATAGATAVAGNWSSVDGRTRCWPFCDASASCRRCRSAICSASKAACRLCFAARFSGDSFSPRLSNKGIVH